MKTGAVITAAGIIEWEFKPMLSIASISVAQRIIATLQQCDIAHSVVTGHNAENRKAPCKKGVIFLRQVQTTEMFDSACIGLCYIRRKCDRILFL